MMPARKSDTRNISYEEAMIAKITASRMGYLSLVLQVILGAIFILAGLGKITSTEARVLDPQMAAYLGALKFIPTTLANSYVGALPWIELVIGVCLVIGILSRFFAAAAIAVVASFIIANSIVFYQNWTIHGNLTGPCPGCFGDVVKLNLPGALAVDVLMLIAALMIMLRGSPLISVDSWLSACLRRRTTQTEV